MKRHCSNSVVASLINWHDKRKEKQKSGSGNQSIKKISDFLIISFNGVFPLPLRNFSDSMYLISHLYKYYHYANFLLLHKSHTIYFFWKKNLRMKISNTQRLPVIKLRHWSRLKIDNNFIQRKIYSATKKRTRFL